MNGPAGVAATAHVFVTPPALGVDEIDLEPDDAHHLWRVRRLRAGEVVTVADGAGSWRTAEATSTAGRLRATGAVLVEAAGDPPVTLAFAPPKGDRPEWIVQKATEIGADVLVPLVTARAVVRWDAERAERHRERLVRVAREAAMQCRRAWLPQVLPPQPVAAFAGRAGTALAAPGGAPLSVATPSVLVGPEGGWSPEELALGLPVAGLGPFVLRTETAALVACALLVAGRGIGRAPRPR